MGCLILALWPCLFQSCFSFSHLHSWCSSVSQPKHWKSHLQDFVTFSKPVCIGANTKISVRNTQISHFLQIENHHSEYFITLIIFILTSFFSSSKLHLFKCPLELISVKLFGRKFLSLGAWRDFGGTENFIHSRRRLWKVFSVPTAVILELCREVKWIYSKIHSALVLLLKFQFRASLNAQPHIQLCFWPKSCPEFGKIPETSAVPAGIWCWGCLGSVLGIRRGSWGAFNQFYSFWFNLILFFFMSSRHREWRERNNITNLEFLGCPFSFFFSLFFKILF